MRLVGLLLLLGFQLLGEALRHLTGAPVPGPVIGLLLLFAALLAYGKVYGDVPEALESTSHRMIGLLPLLLIIPSAGVFFLGAGFRDQWPAFFGAVVGGTLLTLAFSAALMRYLAGRGP